MEEVSDVDNPFKSPVILSLCTGIGGIERGLERALGKISIAAYVEIETFIIENLLAAMESGLVAPSPIWTDLKTFPHEEFHGKIHGIIGGYPCQPFSVAGNQKGTEDPRHLFPFILEIVRSVRPVWCFFENVSGHLSLGYDEVYRSLHNLGYRVEAGIFTAEEVGAPHQRERLFILAIDNQLEHTESWWRRRVRNQIEAGKGYGIVRTSAILQRNVMANTVSVGSGRWRNGSDYQERKICKNESNHRNGFWCKTSKCSQNVSNTNNPRSQRLWECDRSERWENQDGHFGSGNRWPSRPYEPQFEWEEPRTVKSGMGCTINGYNFREDLLRAFGNAVVEQTAELAFIELLKKHNQP